MTGDKVCGGKTHRGEPCQKPPGWGRKDVEEGPCKYHTEDRVEKLKSQARGVADLLEEELIPLQQACEKQGISVPTLHRLRYKYPDIGERVDEALMANLKARGTAIEDSAMQKILEGDASASLYKFMLQNYLPERFRDTKTLKVQEREEDPVDKLRALYAEETGLKVEKDEDGE